MAFVYDGAGSLASIRISLDILLLVEIALLAIEDNCTGALFSSISGANETCELAKSRHTIGANNENFSIQWLSASLRLHGVEDVVAFLDCMLPIK